MAMLLFSINGFTAVSGPKWSVSGFYGMGFINPVDLNKNPAFATVSPRPKNLTSAVIYGGSVGYFLSSKIKFSLMYDSQFASEPTRTTVPSVRDTGFEVTQNNLWGKLDYYLKNSGKLQFYVGAAGGYPLYSHVKLTTSSKTNYDADKTFIFAGFLGTNLNFSKHFGLFIQGGYQSIVMPALRTSTGARLSKAGGGNAQLDLSGAVGHAGLTIMF